MNLQVIGANFGRTGTLSLKRALQMLGFSPCLHMSHFVADTGLCTSWLEALASDDGADWKRLLGDYSAAVDWPACLFVESLLAAAPDARVIYTLRDFDSWYQSVNETIFPALRWARHIPAEKAPAFIAFVEEIVGRRTFGGRLDRASARELYHRHQQHIIDTVPSEQLLMFDIQEGWGPLCEFLSAAQPQVDFPNENASGEFFALLSQLRRRRKSKF